MTDPQAPREVRFLTQEEREEALRMHREGKGVREIARHLNRAPSTISRLLRKAGESPSLRLVRKAQVKRAASRASDKARLRALEQTVASLKREVAQLKQDMARLEEKVRRRKRKRRLPAESETASSPDEVIGDWVS